MKPRKYYSQHGEDLLLWTLFDNQSSGFFVEVGAFNGVHYSNTLSFEEQGWKGICIEAHPDYFPLCERARSGSVCIFAACVGPDHSGHAQLQIEPLGLLSGIRASETLNLSRRYARRKMTFPGFRLVDVLTVSLDEVLALHGPQSGKIDLLSIDVEGTELDVLQGFSGEARIILVEANTPAAGKQLENLLSKRGYTFSRSLGANYFFTRDKKDAAFLRTASASGRTERTSHPLGGDATLHETVGRVFNIMPVKDI